MNILDTQIISYKYNKSKEIDVRNTIIPSIVAIEFLLMQTNKPYSANYYIPRINRSHMVGMKIDHPFNKSLTDSIIFNFKQLHQPFAIFSNYNISELINTKNIDLFDNAVNFKEKKLQKDLKKKIRFIVDNNIFCEPIVEKDIEIGYKLLEKFLSKYSSKDDFSNTWNDILILSKSISKKMTLLTEDKLLNTFASESFNANCIRDNGILNIDFSKAVIIKRKPNRETKEYINNGWQYKMRKNII